MATRRPQTRRHRLVSVHDDGNSNPSESQEVRDPRAVRWFIREALKDLHRQYEAGDLTALLEALFYIQQPWGPKRLPSWLLEAFILTVLTTIERTSVNTTKNLLGELKARAEDLATYHAVNALRRQEPTMSDRSIHRTVAARRGALTGVHVSAEAVRARERRVREALNDGAYAPTGPYWREAMRLILCEVVPEECPGQNPQRARQTP